MRNLFSFRSTRTTPRKPISRTARLGVESLEQRDVPAGFFFTGVGSNTDPAEPFARVYDATNPGSTSNVVGPGNINAFPGFAGSVRVAAGDVNGDGTDDIIRAQGLGAGSGSQVKIYDGKAALFTGTATQIASFFVYSDAAGVSPNPGFGGGVFVAAIDLNGDGFDELITTPGAGARGHLKVLDFNNGSGGFLGNSPTLRTSFYAYTDFAGEVRVTALTRTIAGVETPFIATASGAGTTQCDVRLYQNAYTIGGVSDGTFVPPAVQFFPFPGYTGGVSVAAGDTDLDGDDELFVSKNDGISNVRVFNIAAVIASGSSTPTPVRESQAFVGFTGEVRLGAADVDGDGKVEVLTSTGSSPGAGGSHIKAWSVTPAVPTELRSFFAYAGYVGGVWLSTTDFTWTQSFTSADTPVNIPDNGALLPRSTIAVNPQTLTDGALTPKKILVDLVLDPQTAADNHNEDLKVVLQAPDLTQLTLFSGVNIMGSGFHVTISDLATAPRIETAATGAPLTGTFRPQTPASLNGTFGNTLIAGSWSLLIQDMAASDVYTLTSWTLRFTN